MATWIAHLRVAELCAGGLRLDGAAFAVGSVAPDSGTYDPHAHTYLPPQEVTHYYTQGVAGFPIADADFYRDHLTDPSLREKDLESYSFRLGYLTHLLTDALWRHAVHQPSKRLHREEMGADRDFVFTMKRDWYGLDYEYLLNNPDWGYWPKFREARYRRQLVEFLTVDLVSQKHSAIVAQYECPRAELERRSADRPHKYLSERHMSRFVRRAAGEVKAILLDMPYPEVERHQFRSLIQIHRARVSGHEVRITNA